MIAEKINKVMGHCVVPTSQLFLFHFDKLFNGTDNSIEVAPDTGDWILTMKAEYQSMPIQWRIRIVRNDKNVIQKYIEI